ncbi:Disease resistance protein RGA2 [Bienertia sinuspersici]
MEFSVLLLIEIVDRPGILTSPTMNLYKSCLTQLHTKTRFLLQAQRITQLFWEITPGFENLSSLRILSRFLVGRPCFQSASGLKSLGNLNHLRGRLMIELSDNWTTLVNEAAKPNLSTKSKLTELRIKWGPTRHIRETNLIEYQQLLDGLQPPSGLKALQGQDLPSWARGNELAFALPNLINVSIDGCGQCETLPPFSCLPHLKRLCLQFMHSVQLFENSDNQSMLTFFPSLQELTLHSFYSLKGWWKEETQTRSVSFNSLQKLKVWSCPKLESMPLFPNVEVLDMQNISKMIADFLSR